MLRPQWLGLPARATGHGTRARGAAHAFITRIGYLQLDSVAVAGARSHAIVLGSRLDGLDTRVGESLLVPGAPLFEYWGHEASWLPIALYPAFAFRRREYRVHPWWGDVLGTHRRLADRLLARIEAEGPLRSLDLEGGETRRGWGSGKLGPQVMEALWSAGELAVRERRSFQRTFDLTERVIPPEARAAGLPEEEALEQLLLKALDGHGWATTGTLAATWRLRNRGPAIKAALARLAEGDAIVPCDLVGAERPTTGWIRPASLTLAERLGRVRPRRDRGVLLSPFDPVLWDRARVRRLFGFEQRLEIYKPPAQREFGYYCLPVLAGDALVARVDLRARRREGTLAVLAVHPEPAYAKDTAAARAVETALARFARYVDLRLSGHGWPARSAGACDIVGAHGCEDGEQGREGA